MVTFKDILINSRTLAVCTGFAGGFMPTLGRFLAIIDVPPDQVAEYPYIHFWIGGIIIGLIGLFYVLISGEKNSLKSFGQGAGAPALLSVGGTSAAVIISAIISIHPVAYAMEYKEQVVPTDSINLTLISDCKDTLELIAADKIYYINDTTKIKIPRWRRVKIRDHKSSMMLDIPQKDSATIKIKIKHRKKSRSFFDGLLPLQSNLSKKMAPRSIEAEEEVLREE